jgi:hypothetical protein
LLQFGATQDYARSRFLACRQCWIDLDIVPPKTSVGQGMTTEPESLVLQLLRALRGDLAKLDAKPDKTRSELKSEFKTRLRLRGETNSLRADLASDMLAFHKQTGEQIEDLRQTILDYHSAVAKQAFSAATSMPLAPTQRKIARDGA